MTDETVTFEKQVESAATEADLPDVPVMTMEEEAIPAPFVEPESVPVPAPVKAAEPVVTPPQTVPLAVHIRQREKMDRELNELRQTVNQGNQRLQQLMETLTPAPVPIDRNTDPLGATLQEMDSLRGDIQQTKKILETRQREETQRAQITAFQNAVISDEEAFTQQANDYPQAVQYAKDMKFREYVALGLDAQQAAGRVQQDAYALAQHAFQQGLSPSELAYRMAAALGYTRKQAAAAIVDEELATEPTPATQAEQAVKMRAAGATRGKTTGGAASTGGALTFAELANLDNEEFAKMTSGKKWDRLFKGA